MTVRVMYRLSSFGCSCCAPAPHAARRRERQKHRAANVLFPAKNSQDMRRANPADFSTVAFAARSYALKALRAGGNTVISAPAARRRPATDDDDGKVLTRMRC